MRTRGLLWIPRAVSTLLALSAAYAYRLGRELYEAAPGPKTLWTVPGGDHNDLLEAAGPEYRGHLRRFYATLPIPVIARRPTAM